MTIYTYGYSGGSVADLLAHVRAGCVALDVRYSPNSRVPHWRKEHLEAILADEYRWVPSLGNLDYRSGGSIRIADLQAGLRVIGRYVREETPVVLLCACPDWRSCHRLGVAQAAAGCYPQLVIRHLAPGERIAQEDP